MKKLNSTCDKLKDYNFEKTQILIKQKKSNCNKTKKKSEGVKTQNSNKTQNLKL